MSHAISPMAPGSGLRALLWAPPFGASLAESLEGLVSLCLTVADGEEALEDALARVRPHLLLLSHPDFASLQKALQTALVGDPDLSAIVLAKDLSAKEVSALWQWGATGLVWLDEETAGLGSQIEALWQRQGRRRHAPSGPVPRESRPTTEQGHSEPVLRGTSAAMQKLHRMLDRVAATDAHVLLTGESGSGKELAARAIHERSGRHAGPWVPVNCAAIPETLVESELFGHSQGAFTDASHARLGLLLQADGGTLFLDEVGELPYAVQSKFLRLLEDHVVRPLGGTSDVPCSIRIVAATNRCLPDMVRDGQFRADLYHRLHVIGIHVPPLRHRLDDIPDLAQFFLEQTCIRWNRPIPPVSAALLERFCHYRWPGNVRELRNVIEHAVALSLGHEELSFEHMPSRWLTDAASVNDVLPPATSGAPRLDHMTHAHILKVLETTGGNRSEAARVLGIDRATLYRKLNKMSSREAQNRAK